MSITFKKCIEMNVGSPLMGATMLGSHDLPCHANTCKILIKTKIMTCGGGVSERIAGNMFNV